MRLANSVRLRVNPGDAIGQLRVLGKPFYAAQHAMAGPSVAWVVCECKCGRVGAYDLSQLRGRRSRKSCGCKTQLETLIATSSNNNFAAGTAIGSWTVLGVPFWIRHASADAKHRVVVCRCRCGTIAAVRCINRKKLGSVSCGCIAIKNSDDVRIVVPKELRAKWGSKNRQQSWSLAARTTKLLRAARVRAARKNLPFTLTFSWLYPKLQSGTCEATSIPFDLQPIPRRRPFAPSIDQIRPSAGYTPDNCQVVVWMYNMAKLDYAHNDVVAFARAVVANEKGKVSLTPK